MAVTMRGTAAVRSGRITSSRKNTARRHRAPGRAERAVQTKALTPINYAVSGSTFAMLFLGRFVFRDFQKSALQKQGLPVQNGQTHFDAGDLRAAEQEGVVTASLNDPVGFSIVDVLSWGSLGHALGFAIAVLYNNGAQ